MKNRFLMVLFLALAAAPAPDAVHAAAVSCDGGIVAEGDTRMDLLAKCGAPDARESHDEEIAERLGDGTRRKQFITVEDWTYNFGPNRLQRIVTLKNGVVSDIRTGGYGY